MGASKQFLDYFIKQQEYQQQQPHSSPAATYSLAQAQAQTSDTAEIERLEEEERRLDREIVESERLANLKFERERVRRLLEQKRGGVGGGGGVSGMGIGGGIGSRGGG